MGLSPEASLWWLMAGLYLWDAAQWVPPGHVLLERRGWAGRGVWRARFAPSQWQWRRRELVWPAPLMPWRAVVILPLDLKAMGRPGPVQGEPRWPELPMGSGWPLGLLMLLLFAVLPAALWLDAPPRLLWTLLAEVYLCVLLGLVVLWAARPRLGLTHGDLFKIAAESLLCPPLALNALRKASLKAAVGVPPSVVWQELDGLDTEGMSEAQRALWQALCVRVAEALDWAPETGGEREQLLAAQRWLLAKEVA